MQVIPDDADGHPDRRILDAQLQRHSAARTLIGTFSPVCSVTGASHDVHALARILHRRDALAVFDFSTAGASVASCHIPFATGAGAAGEAEQPLPPPPRLDGIIMAAGALVNDHEAAGAVVFRKEAFQAAASEPGPFRAHP